MLWNQISITRVISRPRGAAAFCAFNANKKVSTVRPRFKLRCKCALNLDFWVPMRPLKSYGRSIRPASGGYAKFRGNSIEYSLLVIKSHGARPYKCMGRWGIQCNHNQWRVKGIDVIILVKEGERDDEKVFSQYLGSRVGIIPFDYKAATLPLLDFGIWLNQNVSDFIQSNQNVCDRVCRLQ